MNSKLVPPRPFDLGRIVFPGRAPTAAEPSVAEEATAIPSRPAEVSVGPWGRLERVPFVLEAPTHQLERAALPSARPRWYIKATEADAVIDRLVGLGLPTAIRAAILQPANRVFQGDQIVLFPPPNELLKIDPVVRAAIYGELRQHPANLDIVNPCVIGGGDVDLWFAGATLRPELLGLIKQLSYPLGSALAFSDAAVVAGAAQGEAEVRGLVAALVRAHTLMLRLQLEPGSRIKEIAAYWDAGPRRAGRSVAPLLRSMAAASGGECLDVVHLLPAHARSLLYNFVELSAAAEGAMPDCHWTSLNFFHPKPEPVYLDPSFAAAAFNERFTRVKPPYRFGDIVVFQETATGRAFHSCVHIADGIMFTKNGAHVMSPWVFQPMDYLKQIYLREATRKVQGYREI
jgi:hypothetical protein